MKSSYQIFIILILTCCIGCFITSPLFAWQVLNGIAISTENSVQLSPTLVSDGSGGAIITWDDNRSAADYDIYAQRVNTNGSTLWTPNGVAICTAATTQTTPGIISDDAGGAIITWQDPRNGNSHIYAQRVNSIGSTLWTLNGIVICTVANTQSSPKIVSDSSGGAIITWLDSRSGGHLYAQRLNSGGKTLWTTNGVPICSLTSGQFNPNIVSDGQGGAIIAWDDSRSGYNIYAQRVNSGGTTLWTLNGVGICTVKFSQYNSKIVNDGSGGAIITWQDYRSTTGNLSQGADIYTQRVNSSGVPLWTLNGVAICTVVGNQIYPSIICDGANGAIITWQDLRNGLNYDIYAQAINSDGSTLWTLDGAVICTADGDQYVTSLVRDGVGGATFIWVDYRSGDADIYVQRVNSNCAYLMTLDGVPVCVEAHDQQSPALISNGAGCDIMTWEDQRFGIFNTDIYAQQINVPVPVNDWWKY